MMDPKEFIIKKFETNYPEIVELLEIWAKHSIEQNWNELCVVLNHHTVPNCPPDEWSEELQANKRYHFFFEFGRKVADYLFYKGYTWVSQIDGDQLISPDGRFMRGYVVKARLVTEEDKKK